jgi:LuxR family maltose regulon positive regulatory protein
MTCLGETGQADEFLAGLAERERDSGGMRMATAALRLAQDNPGTALAVLGPVLDSSVRVGWQGWLTEAYLLAAIAHEALGASSTADADLERALDGAESDGVLLWFLLHPVPALLERHRERRTAHAALVAAIMSLLAGVTLDPPRARHPSPAEPLSESELRVLRYLPTNLTAPEIANELYVSRNTVKTHTRNLYAKLGTHRRAEAVERGRELGLLAPSAARFSRSG